ncbi:helix-turn-helix domain-containing protein [Euzebya sp.]|uniref:helix-turn-helix domain-containing protein n=1 Tax=Euzebya sp. TaxID=1971409 RepID=UPI0035170C5A
MGRTRTGTAAEPIAFAFDWLTREPTPPVSRVVESIWYARGTVPYARERIAPTGSTVAVLVLGDPIVETPDDGTGVPLVADRGFLIGPHTRPVVNAPTGETFAVGIVTTPVGCEAVFGVAPAAIRWRVVDLEATWPAATALRRQVLAADGPEAMLDVVTQALARTAAPTLATMPRGARVALGRCEDAVALVEADPTTPIRDVAAALGVTHSQLDRDFARVVGLSPRALARLLRVRRLLEALDVRTEVPWRDLAADLGWVDQSHLIRDFVRHTGVTPTAYLAAQRRWLAPAVAGDGAGFVPER